MNRLSASCALTNCLVHRPDERTSCVKLRLTELYTALSITHSRQLVVARTVAALGAEYSRASSPKELRLGVWMRV
jgi:hypothetical protein